MNFRTTNLQPFGLLIEPVSENSCVQELEIESIRELFRREHLLVLRGFRTFTGSDDFSEYCEHWGEVSLWPFGKVLELIEHDNPDDHIFDSNYVPLHWDGMYRLQVPEYQIFHCVQAPLQGKGGRTTFSNTALALKAANHHERALWEKVTATYQRKMEFYDSKTVSPIITRHPFRDYQVIRYNEPPIEKERHFVNPPILSFDGIGPEQLVKFHTSLQNALHSPNHYYAHEWRAGDLVLSDNFTLLHGREAFTSKAPRHLRRVHVLSDPPLDNPGLESYQ